MKIVRGVFVVLVALSITAQVASDLMDVASSAVFGSTEKKKTMSCYQCVNATSSLCNDIVSNSSSLIKECESGANGCIKRFFIDDGYMIMSRECYYGPVKILHDFSCDGAKFRYKMEKCYMCSDNMCNSTKSVYAALNKYNLWILLAAWLISHKTGHRL